jgi:hypothetical protein
MKSISCSLLLISALASADEAHVALERAQKSAGGAERLAAIRDITRTLELTDGASASKADRTLQIVPPSIILQRDLLAGAMGIQAFFDGESGVIRSQWGLDALPDWQLAAARQDVFRQLETLLLSDRMPSRTVSFVDRQKLDKGDADVVEIAEGEQMKVRLWIDAGSGELRKMSYPQMTTRGEGPPREDLYDDPVEFDGVRLPSRITTVQQGAPVMEILVKNVRYNTGLDAAALKKIVTEPADTPPSYK